MVDLKIVNVVSTATLNQNVSLEEIRKFEEIFHDSDVYGGRVAYFKTDNMIGKVSIFPSGKMISVGTKSADASFCELDRAKDFFVNKGLIEDVHLEPKVRNMVICATFSEVSNLENLAFRKNVIYEPEQFPGAILRISDPCKASVLIFSSGKTVITGLTNTNQIDLIVKKLEEIFSAN